jgi:hypothetical protein
MDNRSHTLIHSHLLMRISFIFTELTVKRLLAISSSETTFRKIVDVIHGNHGSSNCDRARSGQRLPCTICVPIQRRGSRTTAGEDGTDLSAGRGSCEEVRATARRRRGRGARIHAGVHELRLLEALYKFQSKSSRSVPTRSRPPPLDSGRSRNFKKNAGSSGPILECQGWC